MSVSSRTRRARVPAQAGTSHDRAADLYDRYAAGLYRQALLTLDDADLAERAVCDVILAECRRPPETANDRDDTNRRLAVSAHRRCRELAGSVDSSARRGGFLSQEERGVLGLVLFGRLERGQACRELMMSPADLAVLLHTALHK